MQQNELFVPKEKRCTKCKQVKPLTEFQKDRGSKDGRCRWCKECRKPYNRTAQESREYVNKNPAGQMLTMARQRARKMGIAINISKADIVIPDVCPVLGIPIHRCSRKRAYNSPSLDRIDNTKGYVKGNVWVISRRANTIKSNATPEEIFKLAETLKRVLASVEQASLATAPPNTALEPTPTAL